MRFIIFLLFCFITFQTKLKFKNDKFKIVQFTDLHLGEYTNTDTKSIQQMEKILEIEKPDLVVLSGDVLTGYWGSPSKEEFERRWKMAVEPMKSRKVPWAFCNGNHDAEGPLNRREIVDLDRKLGGLSKNGPKDVSGSSNYFLPIYKRNKIKSLIYFFDSMNDNCEGTVGWGCVGRDAVKWYKKTSDKFQRDFDDIIPSLAFIHIPLPEMMKLWNKETTFGYKGEDIACSVNNTGLYNAFYDQQDVKMVLFGHDHKNDFHGTLNGM